MSAQKHNLILKVWKRIHIPVVIVAFSCMLAYSHHRENIRIAEASNVPETLEEAVLPSIAREAEYMKDFQATAYCITGITKSGVYVEPGHVAADPKVIPLGSMIYIESPLVVGIYQVTDTGRLIKGNIIDIFIPNYNKSIEFGRRNIKVKVLRYGYGDGEEEPG